MATVSVTPFSQRCIDLANDQINKEFTAGYAYQVLSVYFGKHDVAMPNVAVFFAKAFQEEQEHANMFIAYLQKRGACVKLKDIKAPECCKDITLVDAFLQALNYEKDVHKSIRNLHAAASEEGETHFASFIEENFLGEQIAEEDKYVRIISTIQRMGKGLGEQLFDKEIIASFE